MYLKLMAINRLKSVKKVTKTNVKIWSELRARQDRVDERPKVKKPFLLQTYQIFETL